MPSVFDEAIAACRLAAGINPFGSVENARARDAARRVLELVDGYNLHRVAWELERTALNDGFYGNALRAAKDIPGVTDEERALLDRYATGGIQSMDHCALQRLAMKIDEMADRQRDAADKAKVAEPEPIQAVAFEPNSEQLHGLWDGLSRCLTKTSTINFLRVWIRDWTAHKNGAIAQAMLDAAAGGTGITLGGKRINPASIYKQPEPAQEPVAWMYHGIRHDGTPHDWPSLIWRPEYMDAMSASKGAQATPLYTVPPQHPEPAQEPVAWDGMSKQPEALRLANFLEMHWCNVDMPEAKAAAELRRQHEEITELRHGAGVANQTIAGLVAQRAALLAALHIAEAALSDIGDADREPGDDVAWCEARAAEAIPKARAAIKAVEEGRPCA